MIGTYARLQEKEETRSSQRRKHGLDGRIWIAASLGGEKRDASSTACGHPASAPCSAVGRRRRPASLSCGGDDELDENEGMLMGILKETSV